MRALMVSLLLALIWPALARDFGQWNQADQKTRDWFRSQKSPKNGNLCCDEADGTYAQEDMRDGHYWAQWCLERRGEDCLRLSGWMQIPDDVVIRDPNRNGAPVVWWGWIHYENGRGSSGINIRCYAPGGGV